MGVQKYIEFTCDQCGNANHAHGGDISAGRAQLRTFGLIFSKLGDFCNKECFEKFKGLTK